MLAAEDNQPLESSTKPTLATSTASSPKLFGRIRIDGGDFASFKVDISEMQKSDLLVALAEHRMFCVVMKYVDLYGSQAYILANPEASEELAADRRNAVQLKAGARINQLVGEGKPAVVMPGTNYVYVVVVTKSALPGLRPAAFASIPGAVTHDMLISSFDESFNRMQTNVRNWVSGEWRRLQFCSTWFDLRTAILAAFQKTTGNICYVPNRGDVCDRVQIDDEIDYRAHLECLINKVGALYWFPENLSTPTSPAQPQSPTGKRSRTTAETPTTTTSSTTHSVVHEYLRIVVNARHQRYDLVCCAFCGFRPSTLTELQCAHILEHTAGVTPSSVGLDVVDCLENLIFLCARSCQKLFDAHLLGVDNDFKLVVADAVLLTDMPGLAERYKARAGQRIFIPNEAALADDKRRWPSQTLWAYRLNKLKLRRAARIAEAERLFKCPKCPHRFTTQRGCTDHSNSCTYDSRGPFALINETFRTPPERRVRPRTDVAEANAPEREDAEDDAASTDLEESYLVEADIALRSCSDAAVLALDDDFERRC